MLPYCFYFWRFIKEIKSSGRYHGNIQTVKKVTMTGDLGYVGSKSRHLGLPSRRQMLTIETSGFHSSQESTQTSKNQDPQTAHVLSKSMSPADLHQLTDVRIHGKNLAAVEFGDLSLLKTKLHTENHKLFSDSSGHFVDQHRASLIRMISTLGPVLDDLHSPDLLSDEQYDTVRSKNTPQEQMRQLYTYINSWGNEDKDRVYHVLSRHNRPIIRRFEGNGPNYNKQNPQKDET